MKSTVLAVAVATTMMMFAQSAYARDHHHRQHHHDGHHHRLIASRGMRAEPQWGWPASSASGWTSQATTGLFASAGSARFRAKQRAIPRPRRRAPGRMVRLGDATPRRRGSGPVIQSRTQLDALGPAGSGGNRSGGCLAAPRRKDRRSKKTANGSSSPAMTVMRFARGPARLPARLPSGGANHLVSTHRQITKGCPLRAAPL